MRVYTTDGMLHLYRITRVKRHATDFSLVADAPRDKEQLILQTSEGPRGTVPKLQVLAEPVCRPRLHGGRGATTGAAARLLRHSLTRAQRSLVPQTQSIRRNHQLMTTPTITTSPVTTQKPPPLTASLMPKMPATAPDAGEHRGDRGEALHDVGQPVVDRREVGLERPRRAARGGCRARR